MGGGGIHGHGENAGGLHILHRTLSGHVDGRLWSGSGRELRIRAQADGGLGGFRRDNMYDALVQGRDRSSSRGGGASLLLRAGVKPERTRAAAGLGVAYRRISARTIEDRLTGPAVTHEWVERAWLLPTMLEVSIPVDPVWIIVGLRGGPGIGVTGAWSDGRRLFWGYGTTVGVSLPGSRPSTSG